MAAKEMGRKRARKPNVNFTQQQQQKQQQQRLYLGFSFFAPQKEEHSIFKK